MGEVAIARSINSRHQDDHSLAINPPVKQPQFTLSKKVNHSYMYVHREFDS